MMPKPPKPGQPNPPPERSGTLIEPGATFPVQQPGSPQPVERSGTLIETDDDIRQAFLSGGKGRPPGPPVAVDPPAPTPSTAAATTHGVALRSRFARRCGRRSPC